MFNEILGNAPLFIDDLFYQQIAPFLFQNPNSTLTPIDFLTKEREVFNKAENTFLLNESNELENYSSQQVSSDEAYLFVLNIQGVMFPWKYDYYKEVLSKAVQSDNIIGIVLKFETPGGSGYGLNEFSEFLQELSKPFYAYVKCACSAGYWLCSSKANKIVLASKMAMVGSIGSMVKYQNFDGYYRDVLKSKVETIYAKASPKKNDMGRKMEKGDDSAYHEWLTFHNNYFLDHVKEHRDIAPEAEALKGGIFYGQNAIDNKLADVIMSENEFYDMVRKECYKQALSA